MRNSSENNLSSTDYFYLCRDIIVRLWGRFNYLELYEEQPPYRLLFLLLQQDGLAFSTLQLYLESQ